MIKYTILNAAVNAVIPLPMAKNILKTIQNAGFFSNCTIRLMDIINYFNLNKGLPDEVDSYEQFMHYKSYAGDNLIPYYFNREPEFNQPIPYSEPINTPYLNDCMAFQFHSYKNINFEQVTPFVTKYFTPSYPVLERCRVFENKYNLDYSQLCAVFYRGNDKVTEMKVASYDYFIDKAREVKARHPNMKFLVQPDEREFLEAFLQAFPNDTIYFEETPMLSKQNSAMFFEIEPGKRAEYGSKFFSALICLSKCHTVITHSGNCGLWTALYRGNATNLHQIFNDEWI